MPYYHLCAVQIHHVQTFLFDVLQSHEQEKQTDEKTLKKVWNTSKDIANEFRQTVLTLLEDVMIINQMPSGRINKLLPTGSGMAMFIVQSEDAGQLDDGIQKKLNGFLKDQYSKNKALMQITYAHIPLDSSDYKLLDGSIQLDKSIQLNECAINKIKKIKSQLQHTDGMNENIFTLREELFKFQKAKTDPELTPIHHPNNDGKTGYPYFVPYYGNSLRPINDNRDKSFYIAFLKADLDGMGQAFSSVKSLKEYESMSNILNEWVCYEGIGKIIKKLEEEDTDQTKEWDRFRCCPIFAAGDDIFSAFRVNDIAKGITIHQALLDQINLELANASVHFIFKMRVGIDVTWNKQPIRYYYQRVNDQMEDCKEQEVPAELNKNGCLRIRINDRVFISYNKTQWRMAAETLYQAHDEFRVEKERLRAKFLVRLNEAYQKILEEYNASCIVTNEQKKEFDEYNRKREKTLQENLEYKKALSNLKEKKPSVGSYKTYDAVIKEYRKTEKKLDNMSLWKCFLGDAAILKEIHNKDKNDNENNPVNTHLFNVLQILESNIVGMEFKNKLLYAVLPVSIQSLGNIVKAERKIPSEIRKQLESELLLWHILVRQFHKANERDNNRPVWILEDAQARSKAASYIKLLLMFISPRFDVTIDSVDDKGYKHAVRLATEDINKYFNASLEMLYNENAQTKRASAKTESGNLWHIFISAYERELASPKKDKKTTIEYAALSVIDKSLLFRIKQLILRFVKENPEMAFIKSMKILNNKKTSIEMANKIDPSIIKVSPEDRDTEKERKARNRDAKASSLSIIPDTAAPEAIRHFCNTNFIDSVIVFFSYLEIQKRYNSIFGTKKRPKQEDE